MDRTIVLPVPDNYEMDEITVTYRRSAPFSPTLVKTLPSVKELSAPKKDRKQELGKWLCEKCGSGFDSKRICGQHERYCGKNKKRAKKPGNFHWTDDANLYLAEHCKDPIDDLMKYLNRSRRAVECRISILRKQGLIEDTTSKVQISEAGLPKVKTPHQQDNNSIKKLSLPDHLKKMVGTMFQKPEDTTPIEIGQKVWDFKYHEGSVVTIDMQRRTVTVDFPSIGEGRKFNFDGTQRMIKAWKEKHEGVNNQMGVANG